MAEGRRRDAWYHTALLAAIQAEANRDHKWRHQPFRESEFHPEGEAAYVQTSSAAPPVTMRDEKLLEWAFPGKKNRER